MSQLNVPHGINNQKVENGKTKKSKKNGYGQKYR